jgi:hypothetical protein
VLHYLRNTGGDHTNAEIAQALARPINEITQLAIELSAASLGRKEN